MADGEIAEAVSEVFERRGGGAVVEVQPRASGRRVVVRTYIDADDAAARRRVEEGLWHLGRIAPVPPATVRLLDPADWAEAWKAHFEPLTVGRHFVVAPTWRTVNAAPDDVVLRLDPGMAFGTGLHPTTRLCLEALEAHCAPGVSVLDVGTGSGILAVGAARLGARPVVACDTSAQAAETARSNAELNGTRVAVYSGSLDAVPPGTFDLVVANILARVISDLAPALARRVAGGGRLVVSGVLEDQADEVAATLEAAGLVPSARSSIEDWVALVCQRVSAGGRRALDAPPDRPLESPSPPAAGAPSL